MTKRAALILAGGKARRFQQKSQEWQDKALAPLYGKPLLIYVVENACEAVDEIIVCVNDEARRTKYTTVLENHNADNVRLVVDEKISHISGPNVAILTGLKATKAEFCVTLPCDMPFLEPKIIRYLCDAAQDEQVTVPMWPNSRIETLVMVLERRSATAITQTLCNLKRPRSDDIIRGAEKVQLISPLGKIKSIDPELKSFVNINHHEDLSKLQTRKVHGNANDNIKTNLGIMNVQELKQLQTASELCNEHRYDEAVGVFASCASSLESEKSFFWAGVSRENEGESLLAMSKLQNEPRSATDLDFRGRDAFLAAANNYRQEAEMHLKAHLRFFAERAWTDKAWCESWVMGTAGSKRYPSKN